MSAVFFDCGRSLLSADDTGAVQLLQSAYEHAAAAHAAASGSAATCRLYYKTLQCLAVAHLKGNAHELALNAARTLAAEAAALPAGASSAAAAASVAGRAAQFLCINALCGLGRLDEACEHLAAIAADADVCASSAELLSESATCLMRAGRADAGAAAITALLTAAPEGGVAAALRFVELALADAATRPAALKLLTAPAAAAALKGDAGGSGADDDVAARKRLAHLQAILWNSATTLFESKECAFRSQVRVRAFSSSCSDECARLCLRRRRRARAVLRGVVLCGGGRPKSRARRARRVPLPAGAAPAGGGAAPHRAGGPAGGGRQRRRRAPISSNEVSQDEVRQHTYPALYPA
jgi:hypothetical protein